MAKELSKEQIDAIKNYSKEIQTLKDFVTACRKNPGLWIAAKGNRGFLSMIREIYQNGIDQILDPTSPADYIYLYYNESTLEVIVKDNGKGIPFKDMERVLTTPNTSKNYNKRLGEYSAGMHGAGAKAVNALSLSLVAESYILGEAARYETVQGYPIKRQNPKPFKNKGNHQGSVIKFIPDTTIMGEITLSYKQVYNLIKQILARTPIGTVCDFEAVDNMGVTHKEHMINKDGIIGDLISRTISPMTAPITIYKDTGTMKLETAFVFDTGDKDGPSSQETIVSYCNMCPSFGTHNDGTIEGITKWFSNHMNKIYLASMPKCKTKVIPNDIKNGLIVTINAALLEPVFIGQAKEQLANEEMVPFCRDTVMEGLDIWAKNNPQDLIKLCKYFKDIADLRLKQSEEKVKIVNKYEASVTGYPLKYARPLKHKKEFIIVEGDSAGGTAKTGRDKDTQGLFPIRGKIPNAFRTSRNEFLNNAEIQGMCKIILGGPYRRDFDPIKDVEWEKIIILSDADVDRFSFNFY